MTGGSGVVLITGGASGIGAALARAVAAAGKRVGVLDLPAAEPETCAASLPGGPHRSIPTDVSEPAAIERAVAEVQSRLGPITGVVTSAGIAPSGGVGSCAPELLERVFAVNVYGTIHTVRAALDDLRRPVDTSVVTIASVAAHRGAGLLGGTAYAASKSAVIGFTRSVAREFGGESLRANCVAPGPADTGILADLAPAERDRFASGTLLGRIGIPDEVGAAIEFLLSPAASFITGTVLDVGGGIHLG